MRNKSKMRIRQAVSIPVLAILGLLSMTAGSSPVVAGDTADLSKASTKVIVYYFYTTARCATCRKLESLAQEVIEHDFSAALQDGRLEWQTVNVQESGNEHFTLDYDLVTKSLVLVKMQGQDQVTWKNLDKIWQLVWNKEDYQNYVRSELQEFLGSN